MYIYIYTRIYTYHPYIGFFRIKLMSLNEIRIINTDLASNGNDTSRDGSGMAVSTNTEPPRLA